MQIVLVSGQEMTSNRVREVLLRAGHDFPPDRILSPDATDLPGWADFDVILLDLSSRPEQVLGLLARLRRHTQAPVLAIGDTADARLLLRGLRTGVRDFINPEDLDHELPAALARLGGAEVVVAGQLIAVLAPSGGGGSSTVAVNLAVALAGTYPSPEGSGTARARERNAPLLLDLKMPLGDLATLMDLKPTHTIAELCANAERMDRTMVERTLVRHSSGVWLLAAPASFADCARVTAEGVRAILALTRRMFPHVVVDLDHTFAAEQVEVLLAADVVLLVFPLHFASLRNVRCTLDYLDQLDVPLDRVRLVANRYGSAREVPASKAEQALRMKIAHYIPDDPGTVNRAGNNGVPVVIESPRAKVSRSLTDLAADLAGWQD
jgi:pilus assembly protein CpaE